MSQKKSAPPVLGGILCCTAGFFILFAFGGQTILKCDRTASDRIVTCERKYSGLLGERITSIPAGQLQGAIVQRKKSTYRVVLVTENGRIPLTDSYTSGKAGKQEQADRIDAFLKNDQQDYLTIEQNSSWFIYLLAFLFFMNGGWEIYRFFKALIYKYSVSHGHEGQKM